MRTRARAHRTIGTVIAAMAVLAAACGSGNKPNAAPNPEPNAVAPAGQFDQALFAMLPERIQQSKTINVANPLSNPPIAYLDTDGKTIHGVAPDLSKLLEPILGVKFNWINTPFPGLIPGMQANKFDLTWGSLTDTKEREQVLDFVDFQKEGARLMVAKGNPKKVTDVESLCGLNAAALAGSVQIDVLNQQSSKCQAAGKPPVNVTVFPALPDAELALRSGKADSFFAGLGSANYHARVEGNGQLYEAVGPAYLPQVMGVGMRKGDGQLAQALQAALKKIVADGTYQQVLTNYTYQDLTLKADEVTINGGID